MIYGGERGFNSSSCYLYSLRIVWRQRRESGCVTAASNCCVSCELLWMSSLETFPACIASLRALALVKPVSLVT